jgi:VanZ family protein
MKGGGLEGGPLAKGGGLVVVVVLAVVAGFVVSFAIEYLQAYLPSRDSSLRDLVTNTAGTLIGALAAVWYSRKRIACSG